MSPLDQVDPRDQFDQRADGWARTILQGLRTPFPWVSSHLSTGPDDCDVTPWVLHPAFHGCLDWHSSCHMQYSAVVLLGRAGGHIESSVREAMVAELDSRLTPRACLLEAGYLLAHPGFERPYGWGWAAALAAATRGTAWEAPARLVADACFENLLAWLPKLAQPVRNGQHDNTAFGLTLCLDGARELGRDDVVRAVGEHALAWFGADRDYPSHFEPGGNDFLSPALSEAVLMARVLPVDEFATWLDGFLPGLGAPGDALLGVPEVRDESDGKLVHLYGLALARAWHLRELAPAHPRGELLLDAAAVQAEWARPVVEHGDFMSTHWLVTFELRALLAEAQGRGREPWPAG